MVFKPLSQTLVLNFILYAFDNFLIYFPLRTTLISRHMSMRKDPTLFTIKIRFNRMLLIIAGGKYAVGIV